MMWLWATQCAVLLTDEEGNFTVSDELDVAEEELPYVVPGGIPGFGAGPPPGFPGYEPD